MSTSARRPDLCRRARLSYVGLALALLQVAIRPVRGAGASGRAEDLVLWRPGEDPYRTLAATVAHNGSCQPECSAQRVLHIAPGIPYRISLEAAQVDMLSHDEYVEVYLGSVPVMCNPMPSSDADCSLTFCREVDIGPAEGGLLQVQAKGVKTRDACKCALLDGGTVDCYSALLSGPDETYGMVLRLRLVPNVRVRWAAGPWARCSREQCAEPASTSSRGVACAASSAAAGGVELPTPAAQHCLDPKPPSSRPCGEAPECAAPSTCPACFSLGSASGDELWRWRPRRDRDDDDRRLSASPVPGAELVLNGGSILWLRLVAGLVGEGTVSLAVCKEDGLYVVPSAVRGLSGALPESGIPLQLGRDDSSESFRTRGSFRLNRVSQEQLAFDAPGGGKSVVAAEGALRLRAASLGLGNASAGEPGSGTVVFTARSPKGARCWPGDPLRPERRACRSSSGLCCAGSLEDGLEEDACSAAGGAEPCGGAAPCRAPGLALLEKGTCKDVGCSPISGVWECEAAGAAFGLAAGSRRGERGTARARLEAQLLLSSRHPSFCVWSPSEGDAPPALWFNAKATSAPATSKAQQLCRCSVAEDVAAAVAPRWSVGPWGECGLGCGSQRRTRSVVCLPAGAVGAETSRADLANPPPREPCLQAGLPQPPLSEPCAAGACFDRRAHARCDGEGRRLTRAEVVRLGETVAGVVAGSEHCAELVGSSPEAVAGICRRTCLRLGGCVGFTSYAAAASESGALHRCCFLKRVTRWHPNVGRAACHMLQGVQTVQGCRCQVGWTRRSVDGSQEPLHCGATHGGCCTTPSGGAMPWCPTTSPDCGTPLLGQERWDRCDPQGMAVVTAGSCQEHSHISRQECAAVQSFSGCNQIATALGLPDTKPTLTLSTRMPPACVWESSISKLWLNQLAVSANASDRRSGPSAVASLQFPQLCTCPLHGYRWEVDAWGPCFRNSSSSCVRYVRTRHTWCVRAGALDSGTGAVAVADVLCARLPRPATDEPCSDCLAAVVAARASFRRSALPPLRSSEQRERFAALAGRELATAAGVQPSRLRARLAADADDSALGPVVPLELLLSAGGPEAVAAESPGDALERLMAITRSSSRRAAFRWASAFREPASSVSVEVLGTYSWQAYSEWGPCSAPCGRSMQERSVSCTFQDHRSPQQRPAPERFCDNRTRPSRSRECSVQPCRPCTGLSLGPAYSVSEAGGPSARHGSSVQIACASGYGTVDDARIVESSCLDGQWTAVGYSCGLSCPPFELGEQLYEVRGAGLQHGALRQVSCLSSFGNADQFSSVLASALPSSATSICQNGTWTPLTLVCTGDCPDVELGLAYTVLKEDNSTPAVGSHAPQGAVRRVACAPGFGGRDSSGVPRAGQEGVLRCANGTWRGTERLLECKADCAPYALPEGYELRSPSSRKGGGEGLLHGTALSVQCAARGDRVPAAFETVRCEDGRWSALALLCQKDCPPINTSSQEYRQYSFVGEEAMAGGPLMQPLGPRGVVPGFSHGSVAVISCRGAELGRAGGQQEELRCEGGAWSRPTLRCYADCPAFTSEPEYALLASEHSDAFAGSDVPHGSRAFATCAQGFSPVWDVGVNVSQLGGAVDSAACEDGLWTPLRLRCLPDCPFLQLRPELSVGSETGHRANATRSISCARIPSKTVHLRCSEAGRWHVVPELADGDAGQLLSHEKPFPLDCRQEDPALWEKLSDDEKAMVSLLVLVLIVSSCGLGYLLYRDRVLFQAWLADPSRILMVGQAWRRAWRRARGQGSVAPLPARSRSYAGASPGRSAFSSSPTGSSASTPSRGMSLESTAARLGAAFSSLRGVLADLPSLGGPREAPAACLRCGRRAATIVCFPCGDLCLCIVCAEEITLRFTAGETEIHCPSCHAVIDSIVDAKPAGPFRRSSTTWPLPSFIGRPSPGALRSRAASVIGRGGLWQGGGPR